MDEDTFSSDSNTGLEPIIQLRNLNIGYTKSLVKDISAEFTRDELPLSVRQNWQNNSASNYRSDSTGFR
ncbi:MAG: hypothetical protein CM15mP8_4630 [Methanobacteriota archaeon]|nr:MAG: hypothetical protein CM15mP8_4630 [Euryarchaeota archaeon]